MPAMDARALLLGDPALPGAVFQILQAVARVIALVGDQLGRILRGRGGIDRRQVGFGRLERARQGRGVAPIGGMDLGRDDGPGVEIDRMLGLVGQPGAAVLQLGDLGLADPSARSSPRWTAACPCRLRSSRTRSSAVGVAIPLSLASRSSISR